MTRLSFGSSAHKSFLVIFLMGVLFIATHSQIQYAYSQIASQLVGNRAVVEYFPTEEWEYSTPEAQGMNSRMLQELTDSIFSNNLAIHSLVIVRNGYIVYQEVPDPLLSIDRRHNSFSATKSITSLLTGIAIDQGYINDVDDFVVDFFPNWTIANLDDRKLNMTLEHLLMMRAGFEWDEWSVPYDHPENSVVQMWEASNQIQYILDRPMVDDPGEPWVYSSGASHLISGIIQESTGMSTREFAEEHLFGPLGITDFTWPRDLQGVYVGHGDIHFLSLDMAKIGYLCLNNGTWDGEQIVSQEWVEQSTSTITSFSPFQGYGYQWWTLPTIGAYYASGYEGQAIYVIPQHDLVVVFTAGIESGIATNWENHLLNTYILPAVYPDYEGMQHAIFTIFVVIIVLVPLSITVGFWFRYKSRIKKAIQTDEKKQ
jgi:CubicO group peptidase (beta-lactamase class C family)